MRTDIFKGKSVHPGDCINVMRCLDISLIDFLNKNGGYAFPYVNGCKIFWLGLQILIVFLCIGVPSLLKMTWAQKKYFVGFAVLSWYAIMWSRWLYYEWPERHVL